MEHTTQLKEPIAHHCPRDLSSQLKQFCHERIRKLAEEYNAAIWNGLDYQDAFLLVMEHLEVPPSQMDGIYEGKVNYTLLARLDPAHLSPINQFMTTVVPYILWCLGNQLPGHVQFKEREKGLLLNGYLEGVAWGISQEVGGALRCAPRWLCGRVLKFIVGAAIIIVGLLVFCK